MARALVVQHVDVDAPALVASSLEAEGVEVVVHRTDHAGASPAIEGFDALVVMGGPQSAHSDDGFPTRRDELELLGDAVRRDLPVLGVCLGARLLAEATGGRALRGAVGLEVGWADVRLTPAAAHDTLFAGCPNTLTPLHWHGDTVELPSGAVLLASSERYSNQAFRIGRRAWGIQFHLEADRALVADFAGEWPDEARHLEGGAVGLVDAPDDRLRALAPATGWILGRFASLVSGDIGR